MHEPPGPGWQPSAVGPADVCLAGCGLWCHRELSGGGSLWIDHVPKLQGWIEMSKGVDNGLQEQSSILDLIDSFLATRGEKDFAAIPGRSIHEFGELVRAFAGTTSPALDPARHPIYIGGWPSANFWLVSGDTILSSLLYSGQILVRDPLSDWFSDEQYQVEHLMASRPGYLDSSNDFSLRMDTTRTFLSNVVPALREIRPLVDAGLVVLVPAERSFLKNASTVATLMQEIGARVAGDPIAYSSRFDPRDIAAEANVRGMFVFAPEADPSQQIRRAIEHGLRYFAREYTLAAEYGATYTAAFEHELFLCREGVSRIAGPSTRVVQAILQSDLPVFSGLTPSVLTAIHDDEAFGAFRKELHEIYQGAPLDGTTAEITAYVHDQESVLLAPRLSEAERSVRHGLLGRIGLGITKSKFGLATGLGSDLLLGSSGLATGIQVAKTVVDSVASKPKGPQAIWSALVRHQRQPSEELRSVSLVSSPLGEGWGIPTEPAMSYTVAPGAILNDFLPGGTDVAAAQERSERPPYQRCPCGSGRKFRFCCDGLSRYRPTFLTSNSA